MAKRQRAERAPVLPEFRSPQYEIPEPVRIQAPEVAAIIVRYCDGDLSRAGLIRATLAARAELAGRKLCLIYAALGDLERARDT